ncbi:MAG TPA: hypothetical protein VI336_03350 [Candidatus Saccharimonadales bacterium]|nr:hypothetical protein [Candidatus Saccharimonadales bacterium]
MVTETAPIENEITGLALPVLVRPEHLNLEGREHHPNYAHKREELQDLGGRTLRLSRVYWMPDINHFRASPQGIHRVFPEGPKLPVNPDEKITQATLGLLDVVPRKAIIIAPDGSFDLKELDNNEHGFMTSDFISHFQDAENPKRRIYVKAKIGHYLTMYALQNVNEIATNREIDIFLHSKNGRIEAIGDQIIRRAVDEIVKPIIPIYEEAREAGMTRTIDLSPYEMIRDFIPGPTFEEYRSQEFELIVNSFKALKEDEAALQTGVGRLELVA